MWMFVQTIPNVPNEFIVLAFFAFLIVTVVLNFTVSVLP